ncbi:DUF1661 domain-containing protein, partial [Porphyromonas gulae]
MARKFFACRTKIKKFARHVLE